MKRLLIAALMVAAVSEVQAMNTQGGRQRKLGPNGEQILNTQGGRQRQFGPGGEQILNTRGGVRQNPYAPVVAASSTPARYVKPAMNTQGGRQVLNTRGGKQRRLGPQGQQILNTRGGVRQNPYAPVVAASSTPARYVKPAMNTQGGRQVLNTRGGVQQNPYGPVVR